MGSANGWLMTLPGGNRAAVGEREIVHILSELPPRFRVPSTPTHCQEVFIWRKRVVPIMDLAAWSTSEPAHNYRVLAVVAFRATHELAVAYGALGLEAVPQRVEVHDDTQVSQEELGDWLKVAHSGFTRSEGSAIPILNLPHVFSAALAQD